MLTNNFIKSFRDKVGKSHPNDFESLCLDAFRFQYEHNLVYQSYVDALNIRSNNVNSVSKIPFLPIEFFKQHKIISSKFNPQREFLSSGTTGSERSKHLLDDLQFYQQHTNTIFNHHFHSIENFCVVAILPSYLDQGNSSLIEMVDHLIQASKNELSGYYLEDQQKIQTVVNTVKNSKKTSLVIGVTYALLNLAESNVDLSGSLVMETGGMKGRRKEMTRQALHDSLQTGLKVSNIASEYGMTELLSQAYSKKNGTFSENKWLKVRIRDINDPFSYVRPEKTGGINVIDLANIHSCCFIETKDLGKKDASETFEVLGRFDNSDIRGCNLLMN